MTKFKRGIEPMMEMRSKRTFRTRLGARGTAFCCAALLAGAFFAAVPARAQGSRKDDIVFNAQGRPMAGANVRVCTASATGQPCSPLANIYSDAALTQALANPTATDGLGNYSFYAAPGRYVIEINGPGITTKQLSNVILPNDPSAPTFTSLTTTSGISAFSLSLSGNLTVTGSTAVTGALTVGGAPVPSTAQANTWSAAQTFSQDVISGSRIPWFDVRANGAACNGVTDDQTPINTTINAMSSATGTTFLPEGCPFTPPASYSLPVGWQTIALGGSQTIKTSPWRIPRATELTCDHPALHGAAAGGVPFQDRALCFVFPSPTSVSPVLKAIDGNQAISNIGLSIFNGVGVQAAGSDVRFDHVFVQSVIDSATPCLLSGGFGYYFNGGACASRQLGPPSVILDNPASGLGACDVPRISQFDHTFINFKGFHVTNECATPAPSSSLRFIQNLYENVMECFLCLEGSPGTGAGGYELYGVQMSDQGPGAAPQPLIHIAAGSRATGFFIVNPTAGSTIFQTQPGGHENEQVGAFIMNGRGDGNCNPHGLYGRNVNTYYTEIDCEGRLTTSIALQQEADTASAAFNGGFVIPLAAPEITATPSTSGGTLAAGTYYYMVAGVDSLGHEGMPSSLSDPITVTGTTSSVSIALPNPNKISDSAVTYHIYRSTQPIDQQTAPTVFFSNTLASPFVDTGGAGTSGVPVQLDNHPDLMGGTAYFSPTANGPSYAGMANCFALGKQGCTGGHPGDLQATGIISGTNVPSMAGAAAGDYPCFNTAMVKCRPGTNVNTQSGGAYTIASNDRLAWVKRTNTATSSDTLPLPTTTGFDSGFGFTYLCWGTATCAMTDPGGTFTVNGVTGLTTLNLQPGDLAMITTDTNTSYNAEVTVGTAATRTICSGTVALGTSAIASGAAAATVTASCPGLLSTDNIAVDFSGSPLGVTGYAPSASGMLAIIKWPSANTINVAVVNNTGGSITPGAITLNYRATR
jgi:hypothetical protein